MRQRPVSVMIFGILNIGFALFGIIGLLFTMVFMSRLNAMKNPFLQAMYDDPTYVAWVKISTPLGGVVSIVLFAAGIGLLMLQNWARIVSICYGVYAIITCLVGAGVMLSVCSAVIRQSAGGPAQAGMIGAMIGSVIGMVFGLVYPILLIIFMTRPKIMAAFRPEQLQPAA